ncbi:Signal transducer and activator of transcription b [Aphelenchoides fujianensis]|nr:Signal transducer and activator of transcription b [Aphelenchoides fujianensis]
MENEMYNGEFPMDYEADVQSPSAISVASPAAEAASTRSDRFVAKHNKTAENYQAFKDDVNLLFSRTRSASKIKPNCFRWAIKQQKLTVATLWTQQQNYQLLAAIDTQFEYFGELLEQTLNGLTHLAEQFPNRGFEDFYSRVLHLAHYFLFYSIIVSKQPPSVVVKCGEAENHRRSRFWFNTEIRILGGRAFGLHENSEKLPVQCYLITDDTAKRLLSNAYHEVFENEEFLIEPPTSVLHSDDVSGLASKFDDMVRETPVATKRYCLCYNIRMNAKFGIELIGKKVSLPFAILVGPKADVEAKLFLERSFADLVRKPLSEAPTVVSYAEMADAMEK